MGKGQRAKMDEDLEAWCTHKREQYTLHSVHHGHRHHCVHSVCVCSCRCVHMCVPACLWRWAPMRRSEVSIRYLPCHFFALFLETGAVWYSFIQLDWLSRELQESPGLTHQPQNYRRATVCPAFPWGLWMRTRVLMLFAAALTHGAISSALTASYLVLCKRPTGAKA